MDDATKMDGQSMDLEGTNCEKLKAAFPECFSEGKLDVDKLMALCGEYISDDFEKYEFRWKGKADCLKLAQKRSTGTLRPCPEESVDFDTTKNLYIEGDNLEVLKLLQTAYFRQVKMIYIDPPYNTGNDFVYEDDFADPMAKYKEITGQTTKSNPETMGRYHTNWLNMMYPRLKLAANLLRDDGVIFISIDDNEIDNLKKLCNEAFGEENFIAQIIWEGAFKNDARQIGINHEYILVYAKSREMLTASWSIRKDDVDLVLKEVERLKALYHDDFDKASEDLAGWFRANKAKSVFNHRRFRFIDKIGAYKEDDPTAPGGRKFDLINPQTGKVLPLRPNRGWAFDQESFNALVQQGRISFVTENSIMVRRYLHETDHITPQSVIYQPARSASERLDTLIGKNIFPYPKDEEIIMQLIEMATEKEDIILDFFSGSATTAHAVMQLNANDEGKRRFVMVQLPELTDEKGEAYKANYKNICEIGKERIRRVGKKLHKDAEQDSLFETQTLDVGFKVYKLATSNLDSWDPTPVSAEDMPLFEKRMNAMIDRVKPDRSDLDMVSEIMLKLGIPLTQSVTPVEFDGKTAYAVGDNDACLLLICLQPGLTTEIIEKMADYAPGQIVLAENSLADDTAMSNAHYLLRDRGIKLKLV